MLKIALGVIATNEEMMLNKFLPELSSIFSGEVVAIDYGSTDKTREILDKYCTKVETMKWPDNFGEAKTNLIKLAEDRGYDWLFVIDADENITSQDFEIIKSTISENEHNVYYIPRINFLSENSYEGFIPYFPDLQARLFRLNKGYHYRNIRHCILYRNDEEKCAWELNDGAILPIFIKHYKGLKPLKERIGENKKRKIMDNNRETTNPSSFSPQVVVNIKTQI